MNRLSMTVALGSLLFLSACGDSMLDRTVTGAGIGATAGVIGSAIAGGSIVPGLLVGTAVGAATGVLTTPTQINLGKPIWE